MFVIRLLLVKCVDPLVIAMLLIMNFGTPRGEQRKIISTFCNETSKDTKIVDEIYGILLRQLFEKKSDLLILIVSLCTVEIVDEIY